MSNVEIPWELISNIPLLPLPPGVTQNLDNPESRAYWIYVTVGLCLPIILVFATIRFYVKFFIIKARTRDDCKFPHWIFAALRDTCLTFETSDVCLLSVVCFFCLERVNDRVSWWHELGSSLRSLTSLVPLRVHIFQLSASPWAWLT